MNTNQRLELTWSGKIDPSNKINLEPRILIEKQENSYAVEPQEQTALTSGQVVQATKTL